MNHELKTDPDVFDAVAAGTKTFEIRKDDRGFSVGDSLVLRKTRYSGAEMLGGKPLEYIGDPLCVTVSHILRGPVYGLAEGWVILSIDTSRIRDEAVREARNDLDRRLLRAGWHVDHRADIRAHLEDYANKIEGTTNDPT